MRADARANREDLLSAAARLLQEHGAAMSLRAVAQAAGVGVGTLYRHFPTRRELLTAVLEDVVARIGGILRRFLEGAVEGDGVVRGDDVQARWARLATELAGVNLTSLLAARDSIRARDLPQPSYFDHAEQEILVLADRAVAVAAASGLVRPGLTGAQYLTGLLAVTRPPLAEFEGRIPDQRAWLLDVYVRGLRPE